jgi:hypothetical protein
MLEERVTSPPTSNFLIPFVPPLFVIISIEFSVNAKLICLLFPIVLEVEKCMVVASVEFRTP